MELFTDEVWTGGFYELALEYAVGSSPGLVEAARTVWSLPGLEGCYLERERDPAEQPKLDFDPSMMSAGHIYGIATVPGSTRVACGTYFIAELGESDWLGFYCPMSALGQAYPVGGFPFDNADHEDWRRLIDNWLAEIGRSVFEAAPFRLGVVGFEVDLDVTAAEVAAKGVPEKRSDGLLLPSGRLLNWYPRTEA